MRRNMRERGFSLLEVLIAMALIFFLLTGTAELVIHSIRTKRRANENMKLTALLVSKLESLKTLPFESADLQAGSHSAEIGDELQNASGQEEWQIEDLSLNMKKIDLQVSIGQARRRPIRAVLLLSKFLGF